MSWKLSATTLLFGSLFWLVGLSSWLTITALFSELSLMIDDLPEKYEIFSYLALIIQLANIVPLIYSFCIPKHYKTETFIQYVGYIIISFSFLSMLFMAYYYNYTMIIFSKPHSVMLFILTFCTSTCDCMTSMVYWVWVSLYPSQYIAFLSAGEPSSGIVASILIWIQQLNINININKPRFSVQTYLLIIASLLPLSLIAFIILNKLLENGYFETQKDWIDVIDSNNRTNSHSKLKQSVSVKTKDDEESNGLINGIKSHSNCNYMDDKTLQQFGEYNEEYSCCYCFGIDFLKCCKCCRCDKESISSKVLWEHGIKKYKSTNWVILVGVISAMQNGVVPSISSYALIPYDAMVYVYAITISNILKPFMAIITAYHPINLINLKAISICCVGWSSCIIYIFYVATQSPNPIGKYNPFYTILIIMIFVLCQSLLTLSKTCVIMMVKKEFMYQSRSLLEININLKIVWDRQIGGVMERIGLGIQIGSFIGAAIFFILVNLIPLHLFHS